MAMSSSRGAHRRQPRDQVGIRRREVPGESDLVLDLLSVTIDGKPYAIDADIGAEG